jgi:hypothetical protein
VTARFRFCTTSPRLVLSVTQTTSRLLSLTSCPMESVPVSSETVELMVFVEVLMVAMTSPGKLKPLRTARTSLPSGDSPMDCTRPVPLEGCVVAMVLTNVWLLKLMTEIPPPVPALPTYRSPAPPDTVRATGSVPTATVFGVVAHDVVVVALQVAALKYSIRPLAPSAR